MERIGVLEVLEGGAVTRRLRVASFTDEEAVETRWDGRLRCWVKEGGGWRGELVLKGEGGIHHELIRLINEEKAGREFLLEVDERGAKGGMVSYSYYPLTILLPRNGANVFGWRAVERVYS